MGIILLTLPVGSVSWERLFSTLCCLKLWTCSSTTEERLSGLVMLLIHRESDYIPSKRKFIEGRLTGESKHDLYVLITYFTFIVIMIHESKFN